MGGFKLRGLKVPQYRQAHAADYVLTFNRNNKC